MTAAAFALPPLDLRRALVVVILGVSAVLSAAILVDLVAHRGVATDFGLFVEAGRRVHSGGLYDETATYAYRWSPVLAYALPVLTAAGPWVWRLAMLVLALTMPSRTLSAIVLVAAPFWFDFALGNLNVLVLWFAAWGLAGRRWAVVGFLVLAILVPRPIVVPLVAWFLWREPWVRVPFVALFVAHAGAVLATGWGPAWVARLVASTDEVHSVFNFGPSRVLGLAWVPVGLALGAWAFWRGRPALAGLLVAPYWLPYYFLVPLAEVAPRRSAR